MKISQSKSKNLHGKNLRITIILARFNDVIGNVLLKNTTKYLIKNDVLLKNIKVVHVPGALEIPLTAKVISATAKPDAIIALGVVIKGETPHFEHVANTTHYGLMDVMLQTKTPIVFGILTALNPKQAQDRAAETKLNKGKEFAETAIEVAQLLKTFRKNKKALQ